MGTRGKTGPKPPFPPGVRICTDCGGTKPVAEFVPIRRSKTGFYGPCRPCRTRRAWETRHPGRSYEEYLAEKAAIEANPEANPKPTSRTCTDCKLLKAISEFVPIKACKQGWYGSVVSGARAGRGSGTTPAPRSVRRRLLERRRINGCGRHAGARFRNGEFGVSAIRLVQERGARPDGGRRCYRACG
jgi:hypothetical protein